MFVVKVPVLTEKTFDSIKRNVYVFLVDPKAKKPTIKSQIEYIFNVKVAKVNTLQEPKKTKRIFRNKGYLPRNKRAIVTLEKGYGIQIYPQQNKEVTDSSKTLNQTPLNHESKESLGDAIKNLKELNKEVVATENTQTENQQKIKENGDNVEKLTKQKRTVEVDK